MTTDSTGFRSLVEQIQQRDLQSTPQRSAREPKRGVADPGGGRNKRSTGERTSSASAPAQGLPPFLERRWL